MGPAFSPVEPGEGYHGYRFRIIHDGDKQTVALLAWPVAWGETGVMSFMIDQNDRVYQANLGKDTETLVQAITRFTPDENGRLSSNNPARRIRMPPGRFHLTMFSPDAASAVDSR